MIDRADTFLHKGKRKKLVELLRQKGFSNEQVLAAIEKVPRHAFLDSAFLNFAYDDEAFPIGEGQTISHPSTVAMQTDILNIKKGEKVLEIGTGCGYQTAVLLEMGAKVFTIERQQKLYEKTKVFLPKLGYSARFFYGDGYKGLPIHAPFSKIIVTAGAPYPPDDLLKQLATGGIMVIPIGKGAEQTMNVITRKEGMMFDRVELGKYKFVPMVKNKN
ncbi:MAG TPA: protein-L-isoaspartate(D-aspartate) O-methyltransferase [Bacteroidia bacterium]|jgi:protein-L-isoaspartate(D-aspartate) O-methyltransferase|nr:protein-L-isoaspartate(D-aspartate) O-methyltransferase [Bacteroidia bacterium]